jgi:hypothetical protein
VIKTYYKLGRKAGFFSSGDAQLSIHKTIKKEPCPRDGAGAELSTLLGHHHLSGTPISPVPSSKVDGIEKKGKIDKKKGGLPAIRVSAKLAESKETMCQHSTGRAQQRESLQ